MDIVDIIICLSGLQTIVTMIIIIKQLITSSDSINGTILEHQLITQLENTQLIVLNIKILIQYLFNLIYLVYDGLTLKFSYTRSVTANNAYGFRKATAHMFIGGDWYYEDFYGSIKVILYRFYNLTYKI